MRDRLLATLTAIDGFAAAYFCVDPDSGEGLSVTLWHTREALTESERAVASLAGTPAGVRIPDPSIVETFEVRFTA